MAFLSSASVTFVSDGKCFLVVRCRLKEHLDLPRSFSHLWKYSFSNFMGAESEVQEVNKQVSIWKMKTVDHLFSIFVTVWEG